MIVVGFGGGFFVWLVLEGCLFIWGVFEFFIDWLLLWLVFLSFLMKLIILCRNAEVKDMSGC